MFLLVAMYLIREMKSVARQTSIESYQSAVNSINEKDYVEILNKETQTLASNLEKIGQSVGHKMGSAVQKYASGLYGIGPKLMSGSIPGKILPLESIANKIAETEGNIVGKTFGTIYGAEFKAAGDTITTGFHLVSKITPFSFIDGYENQRKKVEETTEQIRKMQIECDKLHSIITCNVQRNIDQAISDLTKAKKTLKKQKLESDTQDKMQILINEMEIEIENLQKLRDINNQFLEKLRKLGRNQTIGPA